MNNAEKFVEAVIQANDKNKNDEQKKKERTTYDCDECSGSFGPDACDGKVFYQDTYDGRDYYYCNKCGNEYVACPSCGMPTLEDDMIEFYAEEICFRCKTDGYGE